MAAAVNVIDVNLKHEGTKGWRTDLFVNPTQQYKCSLCRHICRDAVILSCDEEEHEDLEDDTQLYCSDCLQAWLNMNENRCPLNQHENASFEASLRSRRFIMKMTVVCPNSREYQRQNEQVISRDVVDTKEGIDDNEHVQTNQQNMYNNDVQACNFRGTLKELMQGHIEECVCSQPMPQQLQSKLLQSLQEEVVGLKQANESLTETIQAQNVRIEKLEHAMMNVQQRCSEQIQKTTHSLNAKIETLQKMLLSAQATQQWKEVRVEQKEHAVIDEDVADYKQAFDGNWTISNKMQKVNDYKINTTTQCAHCSGKANLNLLSVRATKIQWKVKIVDACLCGGSFLGVVSEKCSNFEISAFRGLVDAYGICGLGGPIRGKGGTSESQEKLFVFQSGDIIEMEFDSLQIRLSFRNGYTRAYSMDLPIYINCWYPAFSLCSHPASFELL